MIHRPFSGDTRFFGGRAADSRPYSRLCGVSRNCEPHKTHIRTLPNPTLNLRSPGRRSIILPKENQEKQSEPLPSWEAEKGKQVRCLYDLVTVCRERAARVQSGQPLAKAGKAAARADLRVRKPAGCRYGNTMWYSGSRGLDPYRVPSGERAHGHPLRMAVFYSVRPRWSQTQNRPLRVLAEKAGKPA